MTARTLSVVPVVHEEGRTLPTKTERQSRTCPACGIRRPVNAVGCPRCGWQPGTSGPAAMPSRGRGLKVEPSGDPLWILKALAVGVCSVLGAGSVLLAIPQFGDKGAGSAGVFVLVGVILLSAGFMLWQWLFAGKQSAQDVERERAAENMSVEQLNAELANVNRNAARGVVVALIGAGVTVASFLMPIGGYSVIASGAIAWGLYAVGMAPKQKRRYERALDKKRAART